MAVLVALATPLVPVVVIAAAGLVYCAVQYARRRRCDR